jgi:pimeloyl-ACP methyl ester carboxylesterase
VLRRYIVFATACALAALLAGPGSGATHGKAAQRATHCEGDARSGVTCRQIPVPLDWSGTVPGTVSLHVEEYVAPKPRGVIFLLAGGPGQASSEFFYLGRDGFWQRTFPGYTLVSFDPRGTGQSDPVKCRPANPSSSNWASIFASCAHQLGVAHSYYRTVDNAMDIDGVRKALGFKRIGIYGASYGTDLAVTYARMYPVQTQRLVLDSVAAPYNDVSLVARIAKAIPQTLRALCARACLGPTRSYASDAVSLANSLELKPIRGHVLTAGGSHPMVQLTALDFLNLIVESDLNPGLAAELPAAVSAARGGAPTALLRLQYFVDPTTGSGSVDPIHTATVCDDGPFPWQPDTPVAARSALLDSALASIPSGAYGQLGSWASAIGGAPACLDWPASSIATPAIPDSYPNIPVLAIAGDLDLRAPTFEARTLLRHFPRGHLLTVPNTGHAPLADSESPCLTAAVKRWLDGGQVPDTCSAHLLLSPIGSFPTGQTTGTATTLNRVLATVREAEATWDMTGSGSSSPGLQAGRLTVTDGGFDLSGYRVAPGISLSGEIATNTSGDPWTFGGVVRVNGPQGMVGSLALNDDGLTGNLEGRLVVGGRLAGALSTQPARPAHWSAWIPPPGSLSAVTSAIAAHVGSSYPLNDTGQKLAVVTSAAAGSRRGHFKRPLSVISVRPSFDSENGYRFDETSTTWTYNLCGAGPSCSLPGTPTLTRGRAVAREALELALYTFEFEPGVTSVAVFVPPASNDVRETTAFYVQRSQLAHALSVPLDRTLPLSTPPLPTAADTAERSTIERLAFPHFYFDYVRDVNDGGADLVLTPVD